MNASFSKGIIALLFVVLFAFGCGSASQQNSGANEETQVAAESASTPSQAISSLSLVKTVEIANAARPEIVVDDARDRAYVIYLSPRTDFTTLPYRRLPEAATSLKQWNGRSPQTSC